MSDTVKEAGVLWTVRLMRVHGDELSVQSVYDKQALIYHYSYDEVAKALREIGNKGYHWSQRYQGIPDTCILVGAQQSMISNNRLLAYVMGVTPNNLIT